MSKSVFVLDRTNVWLSRYILTFHLRFCRSASCIAACNTRLHVENNFVKQNRETFSFHFDKGI